MKNSINNNSFLKKYQVPIIIGCCLLALIISVAANKVISYQNNNYYNERQLGDATNPLTSISCGSVTVKVNSAVSVIVTAVYEDGTTKNVTSSASINGGGGYVSFPAAGYVKGVKEGSTTINVSYTEGGVTKSTTVAVTVEADETEEPTKQVESITIISSGGSLKIEKGKTTSLTVRVYYSDNTNELISSSSATWTSLNSSIANVNGSGAVTGVAVGSTSIIATYGGKSASVSVEVVAQSISSISFVTDSGKTIKVGETLEFRIKAAYPSGTTINIGDNTAVTWNSSDSSVVTITDGVATGVGVGTTTITANYQGKTATYEITVERPLCTLEVTTVFKKISLNSSFAHKTYPVVVKLGDTCLEQTISYSCDNVKGGCTALTNMGAKTTGKGGDSFTINVLPNEDCKNSSVTVTLDDEKNVSGSVDVYIEPNWNVHKSSWLASDIDGKKAVSESESNANGVNVFYTDKESCDNDSDKQCYKTQYYRGCGTVSPETPSTPSTPTYSCYKNSTGTEFSWATSAPESGWTVVSGKTEDTCKACFVNSSTNDYQWAVKSPGDGYVVSTTITTQAACVKPTTPQPTYACYVNTTTNDYKWATSSPGAGYVVSTTITTEGACVAPSTPVIPPEPTYACYVNSSTNDYKWATSSPGEGYVVNTTITTEGACVAPSTYACYKNDNNDYKWATSAPDGYTLVSDITNENDCKYVVEVPSTAATVASIVYVAVIVMIIVGGSLVYIYKDKIFKLQ